MPNKQNIAKRLERDHPVLSEDSPLNRHLLRATGLPDMKSLLMALAHPMTEDDVRKLGQKAGNHQAHHNRIKHLREHAIKKHGLVGESPPEEDEETSSKYPRRTKTGAFRDPYVNHEDAGLTEFEYLHKSFSVLPFVPLQKAVIQEQTSKEGSGGVRYAPEPPHPPTTPTKQYDVPPSLKATPERGMPGATAPPGHTISYDPVAGRTRMEHHHINGAGYLQVGPGPTPFRAQVNFNQADPHEAAVHQALTKLGHKNPGDIGNTVLYQDFMPDPHDPTKGQGDTAAPGSERSQMAANIAKVHGGITQEQAHSVLDRLHGQAYEQFAAHPMHHMDDVTKPVGANGERSAEFEVPRDKVTGLPKHTTAGTKPIELKHLARQIRLWQSIHPDQRKATRKWYNNEAHEYIKDLARAFNVPYLKAAGALALYNNGMGWETGAAGAAQSLAGGDSLGVKYQGGKTHEEPTGEMDEEGNPIMKTVGHNIGDPMTIMKQTYPAVQDKINDIVNSSDDPDEIMGKIRNHLKTNKLGNFFMDMIGAAPYHTNTNDRHELAIAGHTHKPGTVRGDKDLSGQYQETANDSEHRYFWRVKNAVAHQLDVDPREVQATNWVHWRRQKAAGTDKGENFPGWKVVREHVDNMLRDKAAGPEERRKVEKRIQDRKDREVELEHIMPATPVVQPGMSKKLATDIRKERSRLSGELTSKKRAGKEALTAQQERWAEADPGYKERRTAALERAETKRKERVAENLRRKRAGQEPLPETTNEEEAAKSLLVEQDGVDYYNEQLRKSYEQLRWQPPLTYLVLRK